MKIKQIIFMTSAVFLFGIFFAAIVFRNIPDTDLDPAQVNDVVRTLSDNWVSLTEQADLPELSYDFDYLVIDADGTFIASTREGINVEINKAIRNRDTIADIEKDGILVGKAIFHNNTAEIWNRYKVLLLTGYAAVLVLLAMICAGYAIFLNYTVFRPFNKMKHFAADIAAGNLDVPLKMDRDNLFGAFTESFDIMREELYKARENERKANQSKKELVASLSHDIKTPLASIKAVSELMLATTDNEKDNERLKTINKKTEQIEMLINNMFHAALEELQKLNVTVAEINSTLIPSLIQNADYEHHIKPFIIPECIVLTDIVRLQQVLDNIISNSYKYAGTEIIIRSDFENEYLVLEIADFGAGVADNELPLLFNKYYRGKNASGKSGYGLGLFLSKYLTEQMSGILQCENHDCGFTVRIKLRLAG